MEPVYRPLLHLEAYGDVPDPHVDYGEACFARQYSRPTLSLEAYVHHHHGPSRRGASGAYPVVAAIEAHVFELVPHVVYARLALAYVQVAVADEAVLGEVGAYGNGLRIALLDAEVDVAESAVKGTCAGVLRLPARLRQASGEPYHVVLLRLIAWGALAEYDLRPLLAVAYKPDSAGHVYGAADKVLSFGNEQDAESFLRLEAVDSLLESFADVGLAVGLDAVVFGGEVESLRVDRPLRVDRSFDAVRLRNACDGDNKDCDSSECFHRHTIILIMFKINSSG